MATHARAAAGLAVEYTISQRDLRGRCSRGNGQRRFDAGIRIDALGWPNLCAARRRGLAVWLGCGLNASHGSSILGHHSPNAPMLIV